MPKQQADNIKKQIISVAKSGLKTDAKDLEIGFLSKIEEDGSRLVCVITYPELPAYLDESDPYVLSLKKKLQAIIDESQQKFFRYRGERVLLLDSSQNCLVTDLHAGFSSEGPGIVRRWLAEIVDPSGGIQHICLSPGTPVSFTNGEIFYRMLTGNRFTGKPGSLYEQVWHKPDIPPLWGRQ
jgi:hypothetical protein